MKSDLEKLVEGALRRYSKAKGFKLPESLRHEIVVTKDPSHGDFASNAAFKLAKVAKKKPIEIAEALIPLIQEVDSRDKTDLGIDRCVVAGGGFVNFYLKKKSLGQILLEVRKKDRHYGESDFGKGRKVLLEFVSANPTGPLTIAHGRQAAIGDCLARILRAAGFEVMKEYYLNDSGRQIDLLAESLYARYLQHFGREVPVPEDGYHGTYLIGHAGVLAREKGKALCQEEREQAINVCRHFAISQIMRRVQEDLAKMGVFFDSYFEESSLYENQAVDKALKFLKDKGYVYQKDGAFWFGSTQFGDDKDRVVKRSTGEMTYLSPDIAYHRHKFERGFQWLINLWGPDHHGYVSRLKAACKALGHDEKEIDVRIVQLTTLYRKGEAVRMSTRAGEFVTLRELVDEVGMDATRFFFIMRKVNSHLDFDLDLAKEKSQENPVYYLQYAHARIASLLKFANRPVPKEANFERLVTEEERELIKRIVEYPKVLARAGETLEPYHIADYLRDLAMAFHKFYTFHRVVTDNEELTAARLLLADAARIVVRNGLETLGISQPESM